MGKVASLLSKIFLNSFLDFKFLTSAPLLVRERLAYFVAKYRAILSGARSIEFMGREFVYDNLLTPALLPDYLFEISLLEKSIDFRSVRRVLDVGGNIGQFAFVLKSRHPHIEVISLEPNGRIFPLLEKNASAFSDWRCVNIGVSSRDVDAPLFFVEGKSAQGSLSSAHAVAGLLNTDVVSEPVVLRRLSASIDVGMNFDFVKVDVEGAELDVLAGLHDVSWKYLYTEHSGGGPLAPLLDLVPGAQLLWRTRSAGVTRNSQVLLVRG